MKSWRYCALALLPIGLAGHLQAQTDDEDTLLRALQDEMDRSLAELQLDEESPPYFVSYTVVESSSVASTYTLGAHNRSAGRRSRSLSVGVRVGTKELDNTNFQFGGFSASTSLPLTNSYDELRRSIWLATDNAYKQAVSNLSAKRSALESQTIEDRPKDFSDEEKFTWIGEESFTVASSSEVSSIAKELSTSFLGQPDLFVSSATASSVATTRLYLDSEGNFHRYENGYCSATVFAKTQSADGAELQDATTSYARRCSELPDTDALKQIGFDLADRLIAQRSAESLDNYNGPVLFADVAAAQFLGFQLLSRVGASPIPVSSNPSMAQSLRRSANPFMDKLNARVFPRFISVVNDPTVTEFEGNTLLGSYHVDFDGMPSRRTELITNGMLKSLLTGRAPAKSFDKSTGSNRGFRTPMPGNLFVEAKEGLGSDELKEELLTYASDYGLEYGLIVRKFTNRQDFLGDPVAAGSVGFGGGGGMVAFDVVKLFADGREEPVSPMSVSNFVVSFFKDIVSASESRTHYDTPISIGSSSFVSIVTPSLLFEDLSFRSAGESKPKLPLYPHPLATGQ